MQKMILKKKKFKLINNTVIGKTKENVRYQAHNNCSMKELFGARNKLPYNKIFCIIY